MSESDASPSTPTNDFELDASPAKNTRSHKRTVVSPTPVLESPTKKRRTKAEVTDLDVWDKTDDEIITASKARWNSAAYDHFKITLHRRLKVDGSRDYLEFKFTCHTDPVNHKPHHRKRMQTAQGTKNLNRGITECIQRRGVSTEGPNAKGAQQTLSGSISKYTPEAHRALIAMRCAVNRRPFRSVADPLYIEEVRLLRPDVIVPSPRTVSRDINEIYREGSKNVKEYFSKHTGSIHLVTDGWTAPAESGVIPMLEHLEHALDQIYNAKDEPPVIRIAAQAALQVVGKYYALTDDNEVCRIAIIMCPEKKLEWFKKNLDWHERDRMEAKRIVQQRWDESYATLPSSLPSTTTRHVPLKRSSSKWAIYSDNEDDDVTSVHPDSMDAYLNTPCISRTEILAAGGLLRYWENARATRPRLAQMALDFLSAPASSVDAERAFSGGRLQVNHLQHGVSSQTFKAQMAVGSWYNTPLMNDLGAVTSIMQTKMVKGKGKASGKGKSDDIVIDSD